MISLGKRQRDLLARMGAPTLVLPCADDLSRSLSAHGYLAERTDGGALGITPAGLRRLTDELQSGRLAFLFRPAVRGVSAQEAGHAR